jgi:L-amino acid N-acyltransferase YncA
MGKHTKPRKGRQRISSNTKNALSSRAKPRDLVFLSLPGMPYADRMPLQIRTAASPDHPAIWKILEPIIRAGETYTLPRDMSEPDAMAYWFSPGNEVFVAENQTEIVGTYYLRPNQQGGGAHVANCGYITAPWAQGRGIGRAMCQNSLEQAKTRGFRAMQFNFVVSTNEVAIRIWKSLGFWTLAQIPEAFNHPAQGFVSALVMYRKL